MASLREYGSESFAGRGRVKTYLDRTLESTECMNMLHVVSISFGSVSQGGTSGGGDLNKRRTPPPSDHGYRESTLCKRKPIND